MSLTGHGHRAQAKPVRTYRPKRSSLGPLLNVQQITQADRQSGRSAQFDTTRLPVSEVLGDRHAGAAGPAIECPQSLYAVRRAAVFGEDGQRHCLGERIKSGHFDLAAVVGEPRSGVAREPLAFSERRIAIDDVLGVLFVLIF